uniref:PSI domain-containing protein n=1 Tax=Alexandrium catenella TaxID=2925 RepID=A0A7S1REI5_ALECA|mmetsp:Transcript_54204/g.145111  ORF Transcript_54204/g.145111 Transcript_54204/m.145111 type:complete len:127 (+) Transcript_54204:76-456(+)
MAPVLTSRVLAMLLAVGSWSLAASHECGHLTINCELECLLNNKCQWCRAPHAPEGRCIPRSDHGTADEKCNDHGGCNSYLTNSTCNVDSACKWCKAFDGMWESCETASYSSGNAKCDKSKPSSLVV